MHLRAILPAIDHLVDQQGQRAGGGDGRVELAQGAGGGVARVEVGLLPGFFQLLVELVEFLDGDEDFAAHDQVRWKPQD